MPMRSSSSDPWSMVRLAGALYADGHGPREVFRLCYGAAFPEEFFLLAKAGPDTLGLPGGIYQPAVGIGRPAGPGRSDSQP
jgi:hypothetical protein